MTRLPPQYPPPPEPAPADLFPEFGYAANLTGLPALLRLLARQPPAALAQRERLVAKYQPLPGAGLLCWHTALRGRGGRPFRLLLKGSQCPPRAPSLSLFFLLIWLAKWLAGGSLNKSLAWLRIFFLVERK